MDVLAREQRILEQQLENGEIDIQEFNRQMREVELDYGDQAHIAAEKAYDEELDRW